MKRLRANQADGGNPDDEATDPQNGSSPSGSGSFVPLYSSDIRDFRKGGVRVTEAGQRELDKVIESGQQVLQWLYGPFDLEAQTGYQPWGFWYEHVPDNIDSLHAVARDAGTPHHVGHLGRNTREDCPESDAEAEAAWRRGR